MSPVQPRPRPVLVVARWHPSAVDPGRGRFVADQVAALAATGRAAPVVVSFSFAPLTGTVEAQAEQRGAVHACLALALDAGASAFAPRGADGASGVPIARLPVARPAQRIRRASDEADEAAACVGVLAARLAAGGPRGIVHAHTGSPDGFAAVPLARALGWPLVITEHASFLERQLGDPLERERYRAAVAAADVLVAVSQVLATQLVSAIPEAADRIRVIPNMVDLDAFAPDERAVRQADQLLFVGGRIERKGLDVIIPAFARARAVRPGLRLRLIGQAPTEQLEARWRALAAAHGVGDAVAFEGQATREVVAAAMREASALVIASRHETFGVVAAEALASGLPVIASAIPALEETLGPDPGSVGALVPPGDEEALAAAMIATCERAARGELPADRLRAAVAARFGSTVVAARLLDLYAGLAPREAAPSRSGPRAGGTPWPPAVEPAVEGCAAVLALDRAAAARFLGGVPAALRARMVLVTRDLPGEVSLPGGLAAVVLRTGARGDAPTGLGPSFRRAGLPPWAEIGRRLWAVAAATRRAVGLERALARRELKRDLAAVHAGLAALAEVARRRSTGGATGSGTSLPLIAGLGGRDSEVLAALPPGAARLAAGGPLHLADLLAAAAAGSSPGPDPAPSLPGPDV